MLKFTILSWFYVYDRGKNDEIGITNIREEKDSTCPLFIFSNQLSFVLCHSLALQ